MPPDRNAGIEDPGSSDSGDDSCGSADEEGFTGGSGAASSAGTSEATQAGASAKRTVKETIDAVEDQGFREILTSLAKAIGKKDK